MRTIKGLIALFLVGAGVFAAVVIYNNRTEPGYEVQLKQETIANAVKHPIGEKPGVVAHQKSKNSNL